MYHTFYNTYIPLSKYRIYTCLFGTRRCANAAQSSLHFVRAFALLNKTPPLGGVTPPHLPSGPVLSVAYRRRAREAGRGAAASLRPAAAALTRLLTRRRRAERALQGGRGAARTWRRGAKQHPVAILHQLRKAGQEVGVTRAAGSHPQAPSSGRRITVEDGDDGVSLM